MAGDDYRGFEDIPALLWRRMAGVAGQVPGVLGQVPDMFWTPTLAATHWLANRYQPQEALPEGPYPGPRESMPEPPLRPSARYPDFSLRTSEEEQQAQNARLAAFRAALLEDIRRRRETVMPEEMLGRAATPQMPPEMLGSLARATTPVPVGGTVAEPPREDAYAAWKRTRPAPATGYQGGRLTYGPREETAGSIERPPAPKPAPQQAQKRAQPQEPGSLKSLHEHLNASPEFNHAARIVPYGLGVRYVSPQESRQITLRLLLSWLRENDPQEYRPKGGR